MKPGLRKLTLTAHVTFSVGWLGAVAAYLAPATVGLTSSDVEVVRACHIVMAVMGWFVIVPLALGALATGFMQSLFTEWGLFRLLGRDEARTLARRRRDLDRARARNRRPLAGLTPEQLATASSQQLKLHLLVHAAGGLLILLIATTLSSFKPWGKTPYGKRKTA